MTFATAVDDDVLARVAAADRRAKRRAKKREESRRLRLEDASAVSEHLTQRRWDLEEHRRAAPARLARRLARTPARAILGDAAPPPVEYDRPVTPVFAVGNSMTGLVAKGRKPDPKLALAKVASLLAKRPPRRAPALAAVQKFKSLARRSSRAPADDERLAARPGPRPRCRKPSLSNLKHEAARHAKPPQPTLRVSKSEPLPLSYQTSRRLDARLRREIGSLHKARRNPLKQRDRQRRGRAAALRLRRALRAALGDCVGADDFRRGERAFVDASSASARYPIFAAKLSRGRRLTTRGTCAGWRRAATQTATTRGARRRSSGTTWRFW